MENSDKKLEQEKAKPVLEIGLSMSDVPVVDKRPMDPESEERRLNTLEGAFETILESVEGKQYKRQGLLKTPSRAAKAMLYFTNGYSQNLTGSLLLFLI